MLKRLALIFSPALAFSLALGVGCSTNVDVSSPSSSVPEGIEVQGVGRVQTKPDFALITLGIQAQGPVLEPIRTQAAEAMARLLAALREQGIRDDDVQTQQFVVRTGSGRLCEQPADFSGGLLCLQNQVQAKVRDLNKVNIILDAAIAAGSPVIQISGVLFTVEKPEQLVEEARNLAMADSQEKARRIAESMNVKLGALRGVTVSSRVPTFGYDFSFGRIVAAPSTGGGGGFDTPVAIGLFDVVVTARARYAID